MDTFSLDDGPFCEEFKFCIIQNCIHQVCQCVLERFRIRPHNLCQVSLRIVVHKKDPFSRGCQSSTQVGTGSGLSNAAFRVRDRQSDRHPITFFLFHKLMPRNRKRPLRYFGVSVSRPLRHSPPFVKDLKCRSL